MENFIALLGVSANCDVTVELENKADVHDYDDHSEKQRAHLKYGNGNTRHDEEPENGED